MIHRMIFLLALMPFVADAQDVFKCVDDGAVSYQSSPCAVGQATERAWEYADYQPPSEADLQRLHALQASQARERKAASSLRRGRPSTSASGESSIGRCERAKAHRDRELYAAGVRKSMQKLREWDSHVDAACRP